ncbi:hypothetical protein K1719_045203 [Acacia pycnantha]|nr:hypothetical protein K1719_045203 [Acacia pycnantha]
MGEEANSSTTGANKGIGYGICKKLATRGVKVVLTARNEIRGLEALDKLKQEIGVSSSDSVLFHQLDVTDPSSIASFTHFITTSFGKLDILVNNAGVYPDPVNGEALFKKLIKHERAREVLSDLESLTREKLDEVVSEFMKDYEQGTWIEKGWPTMTPPNTVAKAALNVYTRLTAKNYPSFRVNSVSPDFVKTDMTQDYDFFDELAAKHIVRLAFVPAATGPTGLFFDRDKVTPLE